MGPNQCHHNDPHSLLVALLCTSILIFDSIDLLSQWEPVSVMRHCSTVAIVLATGVSWGLVDFLLHPQSKLLQPKPLSDPNARRHFESRFN